MYSMRLLLVFLFFFKQKTAYEMRISDWSSDVCSSDLFAAGDEGFAQRPEILLGMDQAEHRAGEDAGDQHQRDRRTPGAPGDPLRADTDDADQGDFDEQGVDREHRIKPMARQGKCKSKQETAPPPCGDRAALSCTFDPRPRSEPRRVGQERVRSSTP